jgi:LmbE family N-acetylglucosaminyl deacetylase
VASHENIDRRARRVKTRGASLRKIADACTRRLARHTARVRQLAESGHCLKSPIARRRFGGCALAGIALSCLLAGFATHSESAAEDDKVAPLVTVGERLLVLAPHPDDETLGAAGLAQRVLAQAGSVRTVIFTAGDGFREAVQQRTGRTQPEPGAYLNYGEQRIREAQTVMQVLGADRIRLSLLGFPDGGLLPLLFEHWNLERPNRSATTRRHTAPYREAMERFLGYSGSNLRAEIVRVMREFHPTLVAFTDPLDEHPDHRAVGLFGLLATGDYMRGRTAAWPRMLAYLVHWHRWPPDSGQPEIPPQLVDAPLELPSDLPLRAQTRTCLTLSDTEMARKQAGLAEYHTQLQIMGPFLEAFVRRTECFSLNTSADAVSVGVEIRQQAQQPRSGRVAHP